MLTTRSERGKPQPSIAEVGCSGHHWRLDMRQLGLLHVRSRRRRFRIRESRTKARAEGRRGRVDRRHRMRDRAEAHACVDLLRACLMTARAGRRRRRELVDRR